MRASLGYDCASFDLFSERFWSTTEIPHFSRRLPLRSLLLYKVHPLFSSFFRLWPIVTKIWNRVERYSFSKSGVLLQPPSTHLVGILAANSSRATQPLQWNDWRSSTFRSWVDVTTALDPFSPELGRATTWRRFRAIFEFSAGHKKSRIQPNSKFFFAELV